VQEQFRTGMERSELLGHAIMIVVDLDEELQVCRGGEVGKGEGTQFVLPFRGVDGHVRGLARLKRIVQCSFHFEALDVGRYEFGMEDLDGVLHQYVVGRNGLSGVGM